MNNQELYNIIMDKKLRELTERVKYLEDLINSPPETGPITLTKFLMSIDKICKDRKLEITDNEVKINKTFDWAQEMS